MCHSVNGDFHLSCPVALAEALVTQSRALPQTPLFGKQDSEAPLSSSTGKKWSCSRGGASHPKASSFSEHKADVFNSTLLQKAQSGPFISYHRDVEMTSPGRSIALEKPPGRMRAVVTPLLPLPGQALSLTRTCTQARVGTVRGQGQGPRSP